MKQKKKISSWEWSPDSC